jgi:acyl-CoA hydrolase
MLRQFLVGGGVSLVTITIHALVITMVVHVARARARSSNRTSPWAFACRGHTGELIEVTEELSTYVAVDGEGRSRLVPLDEQSGTQGGQSGQPMREERRGGRQQRRTERRTGT